MQCVFCKKNMKEVTTTFNSKWGDYELTIKGLKAYQCDECNELLFDNNEATMIQRITASFSSKKPAERPSNSDWLNVDEVADLLRVSNQTVYNMIKNGRLKAVKAGREWRFSREEIEDILNPAAIAARGKSLSEKDVDFIESLFKKSK